MAQKPAITLLPGLKPLLLRRARRLERREVNRQLKQHGTIPYEPKPLGRRILKSVFCKKEKMRKNPPFLLETAA